MASLLPHTTRHAVTVAASADTVYRLVADVTEWPHTFAPTVHVRRIEGDDRAERLRLWALANGEVRSWVSRRELDPVTRRVRFRQEVSSPPVTGMGGEWQIEETGDGLTEVVLLHDFAVDNDDPGHVAWVQAAIDRNSEAELAALRVAAEQGPRRAELVLTFSDSVLVDGPAEQIYDVLYRADRWPGLLPHVSRLDLAEDESGAQTVDMDTRAIDGTTHTTRSYRVGFAPTTIVYKQVEFPPIMAAHTGRWELAEEDGRVRVTSWHTVVLRPERIAEMLGETATLDDARRRVREALGANSLTTLGVAKRTVEAASV